MSNQRKRWTDKDKKALLEFANVTASMIKHTDCTYLNKRFSRKLSKKSWQRAIRQFRKEINPVDCNCNQCGKSIVVTKGEGKGCSAICNDCNKIYIFETEECINLEPTCFETSEINKTPLKKFKKELIGKYVECVDDTGCVRGQPDEGSVYQVIDGNEYSYDDCDNMRVAGSDTYWRVNRFALVDEPESLHLAVTCIYCGEPSSNKRPAMMISDGWVHDDCRATWEKGMALNHSESSTVHLDEPTVEVLKIKLKSRNEEIYHLKKDMGLIKQALADTEKAIQMSRCAVNQKDNKIASLEAKMEYLTSDKFFFLVKGCDPHTWDYLRSLLGNFYPDYDMPEVHCD